MTGCKLPPPVFPLREIDPSCKHLVAGIRLGGCPWCEVEQLRGDLNIARLERDAARAELARQVRQP